MKLYHFLSKIKLLKGYSVKLLFITVAGIHIPLIGLVVFLSSKLAAEINIREIFLFTFGLTFLSSVLSLIVLNEMILPVKVAKNALKRYLAEGRLPHLPVNYQDEVGVLMQSVQQTLEGLDELINEKQDMIALLSHDLRSPINSATSLAEFIKLESDDQAIHEYCDKIIEQNEKQLHLIHTVLNMLRQDHFYMEEGDTQTEKLLDMVNHAERNLEVDLRHKQIQVVKNIPALMEVRVQPNVFQQVLVNIIHNAIKFSPKGSQVIVSVKRVKGKVEIQIQDFGMGFDTKTDSRKAFDRFTSLKRRGTEGEPTTGIGLYLCKKIIQRHHGEIYISSQGRGQGATFHIIIPA